MEVCQAHKQNNKAASVDEGATGTLNNESALLKWALSGLYVADMVRESTIMQPLQTITTILHHLKRNLIKLIEAFRHFVKKFFYPPEELMNIASKEIISTKASISKGDALQIG